MFLHQNPIDTYLTPKIEKYTTELKKYDGMILDIRHYLRDEHTKLNACQGYKVASVLQELERGRADCKKELQRFVMLKSSIIKACSDSKAFEYDEYKKIMDQHTSEYDSDISSYRAEKSRLGNVDAEAAELKLEQMERNMNLYLIYF